MPLDMRHILITQQSVDGQEIHYLSTVNTAALRYEVLWTDVQEQDNWFILCYVFSIL